MLTKVIKYFLPKIIFILDRPAFYRPSPGGRLMQQCFQFFCQGLT